LYILIFMFLDSRWEDNLLVISYWIKFWFVTVVPKYLVSATYSKHLLPIFMSWFFPAFWWRDRNMYLVFPAITSRPASLLASVEVSVVSLRYLCYPPSEIYLRTIYACFRIYEVPDELDPSVTFWS
jgi:hypothetical protein